jgi:hypothetical protein
MEAEKLTYFGAKINHFTCWVLFPVNHAGKQKIVMYLITESRLNIVQ